MSVTTATAPPRACTRVRLVLESHATRWTFVIWRVVLSAGQRRKDGCMVAIHESEQRIHSLRAPWWKACRFSTTNGGRGGCTGVVELSIKPCRHVVGIICLRFIHFAESRSHNVLVHKKAKTRKTASGRPMCMRQWHEWIRWNQCNVVSEILPFCLTF